MTVDPARVAPLGVDLWEVVGGDSRRLGSLAATGWRRPIPQCPEWTAAQLVSHLGGIFAWITRILATGQPVASKDRPAPPGARDGLLAWYLWHLTKVLTALTATPGAVEAWTFSSLRVRTVSWWRRRLAVEVAIHRRDMEHAAGIESGAPPSAIHPVVAVAGIEEFLTEFLAGMLATHAAVSVVGTLCLRATDTTRTWTVDLGAVRPTSNRRDARLDPITIIEGSTSDLLLWLTNRQPTTPPEIIGSSGVVNQWHELRR